MDFGQAWRWEKRGDLLCWRPSILWVVLRAESYVGVKIMGSARKQMPLRRCDYLMSWILKLLVGMIFFTSDCGRLDLRVKVVKMSVWVFANPWALYESRHVKLQRRLGSKRLANCYTCSVLDIS